MYEYTELTLNDLKELLNARKNVGIEVPRILLRVKDEELDLNGLIPVMFNKNEYDRLLKEMILKNITLQINNLYYDK